MQTAFFVIKSFLYRFYSDAAAANAALSANFSFASVFEVFADQVRLSLRRFVTMEQSICLVFFNSISFMRLLSSSAYISASCRMRSTSLVLKPPVDLNHSAPD